MDKASENNLYCMSTLLCFCFFLHLISAATDNMPPPDYGSPKLILLNCGESSSQLSDGRSWTGDVGSKYAPSSQNTEISKASTQNSVPSVPYMTARIFHSQYTYTFPVTAGWKFIRLYFYPANYSSFNAANAIFSVSVDNYTLLRNFSSYITAEALKDDRLTREFSINTVDGFLNLTFNPSPNIPNAYAFVNGIEIVSMPNIFSRTATVILDEGLPSTRYQVRNDTALQTVIRLNVGGKDISGNQDSSSLFRTWSDDTPNIYGAASGVTSLWNLSKTFEYTDDVPSYTAPMEVYETARSMGPNPKVNQNYNLTWYFTVDAGFTYLVRLHFCEFRPYINKVNQLVFKIFIQNLTAETEADVFVWGGQTNGVPVYRDYAITIPSGPTLDLWVALTPNVLIGSEYFDSILNGIEIFKLNDTTGNLGGPNPVLHPQPQVRTNLSNKSRQSGNSTSVVVGGVVGAIAIVALFCIALAVFRRRLKRQKDSRPSDGPSLWQPISVQSNSHSAGSAKTNATGSHASSLPANLCRHFSFAEIKIATNDFDDTLLLGVGGFGKVYRGTIDGGSTKVAIKRGNPLSEQGMHEFQTEIEMLSKLRHRHLVSLIGYCEENCEMILVYDYMANGTLREHLYKTLKPPLPWRQRLEICIGAARGLYYLHTGAKHSIIHRDVKTTNILLDDKWVAKVSDFGLSKTGPTLDNTHVSTFVKGSFGYLDPEYFRRQQLSEKSDVYSFGVVLFEVLCARQVLNNLLPKEQVSLAEWALHCQKKGVLDQIIDPYLKGKIASECLKKFAETAEKCLADQGIDRPAMGDVLWNLEFALRLQESAEEVGGVQEDTENDEAPLAIPASGRRDWDMPSGNVPDSRNSGMSMSIGGRSLTSEESDGLTPSRVFSQIMNPKGR
ncbi:receptor-like protein kinase FERONIA [Magnolia sinica]|uniref:receptor-like protein kinase FERONIA n=1 Tax=Magnolia sinica TaxID=86752 RepID=UPI0026585A34|nr:receptor-like protein kinase FERONIA [Magnolia sinica]XP_058075445.1 receptor-like protein kinase FERONIA [Magnolia sinica]XP_058075446.1 receptor-like protein kinase FERONIA [Magnolia sinica]XP_058075447.1 receptor-like protein kinase FERONIA [Magnolia sinica]XP_058075448.1 receptor-like protein kinase FERONIA [Magnolia sinica]XP_058075449.1 receptor-like protein kinase FERONIA [Magnolia sinica]